MAERSCRLTFLASRGNLLEMECFIDKHKVTMLAGHFSAFPGLSPGAATCLIFHTYQLHQAMMDGDCLSENKHKGIIEGPGSQNSSVPPQAAVCSRGRRDGGRQPFGFGQNQSFRFI